MNINGNFNAWDIFRFGFGYIDTIRKQGSVNTSQSRPTASDDRDASVDTLRQSIRMRKALESVRPIFFESREISVVSPASATSVSELGLDTTGTATTLQSTEEVNATSTSISTFGPEGVGSTAQATIDGEYDGSNGTGTLTFKVTKEGTHGADNLQIRIYDSNNAQIDRIDIRKNDPIDQQYSLSNGLILTLGQGDLLKNTTFSVQVFDSVGSAVDPDMPFNGIGIDDPNLESGQNVTTGSFQINGVEIDVWGDDTINTVLDRINQSDAGVTAIFDAATEKLLLTQKTPGPAQEIVLENDTSGFLAAVKLDEASAIPGDKPETEKALAEVERFATVQSGMIGVNNETILIDVNTDSLTDILNRITASGADVTASFDGNSQLVSIYSVNPDNHLVLESESTNFFQALGISDGTYNSVNDIIQAGSVSEVEISNLLVESVIAETSKTGEQSNDAKAIDSADAEMLGTLVHVIADSMNSLFDDSAVRSSPGAMLEGIRKDIYSAVSSTFDAEGPQFNTDFGIHFDFGNTSEGVFNFSESDQRQLVSALSSSTGQAAVHNMFFGNESNGLLNQLHDILSDAESRLVEKTGSNGIFLDIVA